MSVRRYTLPLSPPKGMGVQKCKTAIFRLKFSSLEESLLQFLCVTNCQRKSCKAFIGLTIRAKIIGGRRLLLPKILGQTDRVGSPLRAFQ